MKVNIKLFFIAAFFLAVPAINSIGQENHAETMNNGYLNDIEQKNGSGFSKSLTSEELERQSAAGLKENLANDELETSTGAGLNKDLDSDELEYVISHIAPMADRMEQALESDLDFA